MSWGTNLPQEDYLKLEQAHGVQMLSDAEAALLLSRNCGFEASRIEILSVAKVVNAAQSGERYVKLDAVSRKPLYAASDWNYIRFNINTRGMTWFYEMINGGLHFVAE